MAEQSSKRGGARAGSGRKPVTLSVQQVKNLLKTLARAAKEHGKDIDQLMADRIYKSDLSDRDFFTAWKLIKEQTSPKLAENGEGDKALGPAFYLPEKRPALEVIEGGKA